MEEGGEPGTQPVTTPNICSHCHPECRLRFHSLTPTDSLKHFKEEVSYRERQAAVGGGEPGWPCNVPFC